MLELLSPAGNYEKMTAAFRYGADAVYLAGKTFGMRSAAENFTNEELDSAVKYAHSINKKVYVTVNVLPRTYMYEDLRQYILTLKEIGPDALIIADVGVFALVKELWPTCEIHISTQAGVVSAADAIYWYNQGAKRVVLARELSLQEIVEMRRLIPKDLDIETFVHGSMCVSFSGRCLLSNYLTGRDGNLGACAQPCRWNYVITEEKRPETGLPIEETPDGTFIMSSKDMKMLEHIPELVDAGISSFKIEGRMKSVYYTAVVTNAYRAAIDGYIKYGKDYKLDPRWSEELESVSHREYGTGYFFDNPMENAQTVKDMGYIRDKAYLGTAVSYDEKTGLAGFLQKNKMNSGDEVEIITPGKFGRRIKVDVIYNEKMEEIPSTPHVQMLYYVKVPFEVKTQDIMRGVRNDK